MDSNLLEYPNAAIWYQKIRDVFDFDQNNDIIARDLLYSLRKNIPVENVINSLQNRFKKKNLIFCGAGPSLQPILTIMVQILEKHRENFFIIAADGATRCLNELTLYPDLIVSDLDGITPDQLQNNLNSGCIASILGHGDNIPNIHRFKPILQTSPNLICTTQTTSRYPIINPGGFTDGDRGPFLLHHIIPSNYPFYMIGYDFEDKIGKYSKPNLSIDQPMTDFKRKKLKISQDLFDELQQNHSRNLIFINSPQQCERFNFMN
ncbi:6-hydroxymethylpterin diphosphokinase MptE-like protein [Candidatus Lokiarchaeum ossiferum]|uniref:6-hydroxymethylpterin diphosphokinase MptE-like protein n=1 Tax=Candidatus Lokiarchaeum ossiferum TaxID=2951803 RepID=UPI00352D916B